MEVKTTCTHLFFMDLINPFCVSGDFAIYINMHNPYLFTIGNTKLQYMSATTQVAAKENQWQNHNKALGAKGVPNEDCTWEYEKIFQHTNLELLEDKQY